MTLIRIRHLLRRQQPHSPAGGIFCSRPAFLVTCPVGTTPFPGKYPDPPSQARADCQGVDQPLLKTAGMGLRQRLMRPASGGSGLTTQQRQDAVAGQARAQHNERSDPAQRKVRPLARAVLLALGHLPMAFYTSLSVVLPRISVSPHTGNSCESNEVCIHFQKILTQLVLCVYTHLRIYMLK